MKFRPCVALIAVLSLAPVVPLHAEIVELPAAGPAALPGGGAASTITLPYQLAQGDNTGNSWMVYNGGRLMQQGDSPMFSECLVVNVNGQQPNMNVQTASLEGSDVILPNMNVSQITLTRRLSPGADGSVRVVDIFRNAKAQDVTLNINYRTSFNYGMQNSRTLTDPKRPGKNLGGIVQDSQGRACLIIQAGRKAEVTPNINSVRNNNWFNTTFSLKVPASKDVALLTIIYPTFGSDSADRYFQDLKENSLLTSLPRDVRKLIANFSIPALFSDIELLRGDATDVVELRNGDSLRGTFKSDWAIKTDYGPLTLPPNSVLGMITRGTFRTRQLIATRDGQLLGGVLSATTIRMELSGSQVVDIPLSQVSRIGIRKQENETEEIKPDKPMVALRNGDLLAFKPLGTPVELATRFGTIRLQADAIESIDLQPEDTAAHLITLKDRSRFTGILLASTFDLQLTAAGATAVKVPAAAIRRIDFIPAAEDAPPAAATITLTGGDALSGLLQGELRFDTSFSTLTLKAAEIGRFQRLPGGADLQVTLWDGTTVRGQFAEPSLPVALAAGTPVNLPVGILESYTCASPQPQSAVAEKIRALVQQLNADDWKQREQAEKDLVALGAPVAGMLRQLRAAQPPEAQQRIDSILSQVEKKR